MQGSGGVRNVSVHRARLGQLFRYQCTCQAVTPYSPRRLMVQRLAKVGSDSNRETDPYKSVGAEYGNGLQDAGNWRTGGVPGRICDREDFAGERGVGRDQIAELTHRHILVIRQLKNSDGDLRKRGNPDMSPGDRGRLTTR